MNHYILNTMPMDPWALLWLVASVTFLIGWYGRRAHNAFITRKLMRRVRGEQ